MALHTIMKQFLLTLFTLCRRKRAHEQSRALATGSTTEIELNGDRECHIEGGAAGARAKCF